MADEYSGASQEPIKVYENTYIQQPTEKQRYVLSQPRTHGTAANRRRSPARTPSAAVRTPLLLLLL